VSWESESEAPSYAGEIHKEVVYIVECFNCGDERYMQGGTQRRAEQAVRDAGWKDVDPDGWCCPECRKQLRKGATGGE
jgi:hypothetical protein